MNNIKLYTFYTETHKSLYYNYFLDSYKKTNMNFELISDCFEQECDGNFMSDGWNKTMYKKIYQILKACGDNELFIHSDCDVYFKKNIKEPILQELDDFDIAFQDDVLSGYCMGFFICKPSKEISILFRDVINNIDKYGNDQVALNKLINKYNIKHKKLSNRFFSYGQLKSGLWNNNNFELPSNALMMHANYTIGIENKMKLLDKFKNAL